MNVTFASADQSRLGDSTLPTSFAVINPLSGKPELIALEDYQSKNILEDFEFAIGSNKHKGHWRAFFKNYVAPKVEQWLREIEPRIPTAQHLTDVFTFFIQLHSCLHSYVEHHTEINDSVKSMFYADAQEVIYSPRVISLFVPVIKKMMRFHFLSYSSKYSQAYLKNLDEKTRKTVAETFANVNRLLLARKSFSFPEKELSDIYVICTHKFVDQYIAYECKRSVWREDLLATIKERLKHITSWVTTVMVAPLKPQVVTKTFDIYVEMKFIDCLIENIYDLAIVSYPSSTSVASDLRSCLIRTRGHGRVELADMMVKQVNEKLLNVGESTNDILRAYASAVDFLKMIDPTNVIMHKVCGVIKDYLKKRPDTVKSIINYITTEKKDQLAMDDGRTTQNVMFDEDSMKDVNTDFLQPEDAAQWNEWVPDPVDANKGENRFFRQSADVFNMLVSIYGSKEQFVKEYRQLLAERLTCTNERDHNFETRYLELMKRRFTDGELQQCEVMLTDMQRSEDFDRDLQAVLTEKKIASIPFAMEARVISSFFWPKLETEPIKLPELLVGPLESYKKAYEEQNKKNPDDKKSTLRTLQWMPSLGHLMLAVELFGKTIHLTLPTTQALILLKFTEKSSWSIEDLQRELEMKKSLIKKRCDWFVKSGVLRQAVVPGAICEWFALADQPGLLQKFQKRMENEDEESDEEEESAENEEVITELNQFWNYTKTFITNQEPVKAERIHSIFKMFASPGKQGPSIADVTAFLQSKVRANMLSFNNGYYRAVKSTE
ncbi:hypothetical protein L596_023082 [Steinernema carpocapsae]|uniref:Anaphase-promoting complex subunit 2 n=1 Tax=Steinernema carpocapsae TaxID=34508 RepID=A0A4U5MCK6_STECR|nr:hypothetical protein L596_023082 [Steinernema carpocapsae]